MKLRKEKDVLDRQRRMKSAIIGLRTSDGLEVKEISKHVVKRANERNVSISSMRDALLEPLEVTKVRYDKEGQPSKQYRGKITTVAVNPDTGNVVSTNPTRRDIRKKYGVYKNDVE